VWYGEDDLRNITRRTKGNSQTKEAGEYQAILETLSQTPDQARLHLNVTLAHVKDMLTSHLPRNEDNDWIDIPNDKILRTIVATLHARKGRTVIGKIQDQVVRLKTRDLAKASLALDDQEEWPHLEPPEAFLVTGVRLSQATQSTLYKGILRRKTPPERAASTLNLGITRACVEELTENSPTNQKIWISLKSKNFPPKIRAFLWKAMHSAYKVGKYWLHIPSFEQRGLCHACENVEESMEHILTECKASGQEVIWNLAKELWALRGLPWVKPRFGTILGCGLGDFRDEHDKNVQLAGANRLYAILLSESAHQIWRTRCKWRISDEASMEKIPTEQEVRASWIRNLNRRLQLERLMTDKLRYGQKALKARLVEKTWWGVLRDQESLPDNWLRKGTEVLVGIGERPPGRNR